MNLSASNIKENIAFWTAITLAILAYALLSTSLMIWSGFVLSIMWTWFLVPIGLPKLGIAHAIGITMIVRMLTWQYNDCAKDDDEPPMWIKLVVLVGIYPALILGAGYFIHLFI